MRRHTGPRKTCGKCLITKAISEFHRRSQKEGRTPQSWCKSCCTIYKRDRYNSNSDYREGLRLSTLRWVTRHKYGISYGDYLEKMSDQNYQCAICGETLFPKPNLDHCHTTGALREFLCARCNGILGMAKDSTELLRKMIRYLEKHGV